MKKIEKLQTGKGEYSRDYLYSKINEIIDALQPASSKNAEKLDGEDAVVQKSAEGWNSMFIKFGDTTASIKKEGEEWKLILKDDRKESQTHITKLFETVIAQARAEERQKLK